MTLVDIAVVLGSLGIPGAIAWAVHKMWPRVKARREREAMKDFVIYGGIVKNPLTGKRDSEQPPLGQWMTGMKDDVATVKGDLAEVNGKVTQLSTVVTELVEQNKAIAEQSRVIAELRAGLDAHASRLNGHDTDIDALKTATYDRIATKIENAAALSMVEKLQSGPPQIGPKPNEPDPAT